MRYKYLLFLLLPIFTYSQININASLLETNFGGNGDPKEITTVDNKVFFTSVSYDQNINSTRKLFVKHNLSSVAQNVIVNNNQYNSLSIVGKVGSILIFVVQTSYSANKQLWRTDGTAGGTFMIKDIDNTVGTDINNFTFFDSKFYFSYYSSNSTYLWASDGTSANTNIIGNFSGISNITELNGYAIFSTQNSSGTIQIYKSSGTPSSTNLITTFPTGVSFINKIFSSSTYYYYLRNQNNITQLCKADINGNITIIKQFQQYDQNLNAGIINNELMFFARENINGFTKSVLYKYNEANNLATVISNYTYSGSITAFKGKVYYDTIDSNNQFALMISNGTPSGTQSFTSTYNIPNLSMQGKSKDAQYLIFTNSADRYLIDGTSTTLKKILPESTSFEFTNLSDFTWYNNDHVLFAGISSKYGNELFIFNNTTTSLLEDTNHFAGTGFISPTQLNDKLIFFGNDNTSGQYAPAISDGTMNGTKIIKNHNSTDFVTVHYSDNPTFFKNGNKLFFRCASSIGANEPCVTDGTDIGTKLIKKLNIYNNGSLASDPYYMHLNDNEVLFAADGNTNNSNGDFNLWKSDGTEAGTVFVHSVYPAKGTYDHKVSSAKINNYVYFTGQTDLNNNPAIWKTDGTTAGTQFVQAFPIPFSNYFYFPRIIAQHNNKLFISAGHWSTNPKLFIYDPTANTTTQLPVAPSGYLQLYLNKMYFIDIEKITTYDMDNLQHFENNYNAGANISGSSFGYKQCGNNIFVYNTYSPGNTTKFFLLNNNILSQPTILNHADITTCECVDNKLLYVARLTHSSLEKIVKITDGNTFTDVNINYNSQTVPLTNYVYNNIYNIFKVQDKLFFHANFNFVNMSGVELYFIDGWNQFLKINEHEFFDQDLDKFIMIYPNPSSDYINIQSDKKFVLKDISAFDMSGRQIFLKSISRYKFDISNLTKGVYLLNIKTDKGIYSKKFIKK